MRTAIKRTACGLVAASTLVLASPAHADPGDWDKASDIGRGALLVTALAVPAVQEDWQGAKQALFSWGATKAVTDALKHTVREERPDGSDHKSFPSGHTSQSFAAAGTLHKRYGWEIGIPAHAVAAFVGVARVKANKHYVHDVLVGAAIGEGAAWLITQPKNDKVRWLPWGDAHSAGASLSYRF